MNQEITQDFIDQYSSLVTDNICKEHSVDPQDQKSRAILAYNLSNPNNPIQDNKVATKELIFPIDNSFDLTGAQLKIPELIGTDKYDIIDNEFVYRIYDAINYYIQVSDNSFIVTTYAMGSKDLKFIIPDFKVQDISNELKIISLKEYYSNGFFTYKTYRELITDNCGISYEELLDQYGDMPILIGYRDLRITGNGYYAGPVADFCNNGKGAERLAFDNIDIMFKVSQDYPAIIKDNKVIFTSPVIMVKIGGCPLMPAGFKFNYNQFEYAHACNKIDASVYKDLNNFIYHLPGSNKR